MAAKVINVRNLIKQDTPFEFLTADDYVAMTADGAEFTVTGKDFKHLVLLKNTSTSEQTVKILKGEGMYATNDFPIVISASSTVALTPEMAGYKILTGDEKGKVKLTGNTNISVAVYCLP